MQEAVLTKAYCVNTNLCAPHSTIAMHKNVETCAVAKICRRPLPAPN